MFGPRVAVIMPVYNGSAYITAAIQSVLDQTEVDFELIVVDDGSSDNSVEVVKQVATTDSRVRVLALSHTGMPGIVRNAGARQATAELLAFLDADDVFLPGRLAQSIEVLARLPSVHSVFTDHYRSGERNPAALGEPHLAATGFLSRADGMLVQVDADVYVSTERFFGFMCLSGIPMCTDTVTVRKEAFDRAGGFSEVLRYNQDEDLWLRLAVLGQIAYLARPLARVWRRMDSHTGDFRSPEGILRREKVYRTNIALHEGNYHRASSFLTAEERGQYRRLISHRWLDLAYYRSTTQPSMLAELQALARAWRWHASALALRGVVRALVPKFLRRRAS